MIIEKPCVSCGISLEKGSKTVAVFDIIKGCIQIMVCTVLIVHFQPHTRPVPEKAKQSFAGSSYCLKNVVKGGNETGIVKERIEMMYYDVFWISLVYLVAALIEILLAVFLYYGTSQVLHFWLIISGLLTPITLILVKLYQLIIVCAYVEEIKCEAGGKALAEFRKLPYVCHIKSQQYPMPVHCGPKNSRNWCEITRNCKRDKAGTIYYREKTFLMNTEASVFSVVQHQSY